MKWNNSKLLLNVNQEVSAILSVVPRLHAKLESFTYGKIEMPPTSTPKIFTSEPSLTNPSPMHFVILKQAIESSFEDYDFSKLSPSDFKLVTSFEQIKSNISWQLSSNVSSSEVIVSHMFQAIECEGTPSVSDIYRYEPQSEDVFSENGGIWNYTYFFINTKQHKVLLLHLREGADNFGSDSGDDEGFGADDELLENRFGFGVF